MTFYCTLYPSAHDRARLRVRVELALVADLAY